MIRTLTVQPKRLGYYIFLINIKILSVQHFVELDNSGLFIYLFL